MAFTKSKKTQPKALKKPPIPRRVPIAKGDTHNTTAPAASAVANSPARSKLLKAAQGEIAERIQRLEREERGEPTTPATTAATTAQDGGGGGGTHDTVSDETAAHAITSPVTNETAEPAKKDKIPKAPKPPKEAKPKRVSALDAAHTVLLDAKGGMKAPDIIKAMAERGLWTSPGGKTPASTLYAAMVREITTKGDASRFKKSDKGMFTAAKM